MAIVFLSVSGQLLPIALTCRLGNAQIKSKIEFYACVCESVVSDPNSKKKKVRL